MQMAKQKRQKKDKTEGAASADAKKSNIEDELDKALKSAAIVKVRTEEVHRNWKDHLFRMALGTIVLSTHQYMQPVRECIMDIKSIERAIEPLTSAKLLFSNGLMELVNLIIAGLLFVFTSKKPEGDFFNKKEYIVAAALVPLCLGLYYNTEKCGCIIDSNGDIVIREETDESDVAERQFPVAVIYHLILTGCLWFMQNGMNQVTRNLEVVTTLQKQLLDKDSRKKK